MLARCPQYSHQNLSALSSPPFLDGGDVEDDVSGGHIPMEVRNLIRSNAQNALCPS